MGAEVERGGADGDGGDWLVQRHADQHARLTATNGARHRATVDGASGVGGARNARSCTARAAADAGAPRLSTRSRRRAATSDRRTTAPTRRTAASDGRTARPSDRAGAGSSATRAARHSAGSATTPTGDVRHQRRISNRAHANFGDRCSAATRCLERKQQRCTAGPCRRLLGRQHASH
jgi:hypothetical protein